MTTTITDSLADRLAAYTTHTPGCSSRRHDYGTCRAPRGVLGKCPNKATYRCTARTQRSPRMVHLRCVEHRNGFKCERLPDVLPCDCGLDELLREVSL